MLTKEESRKRHRAAVAKWRAAHPEEVRIRKARYNAAHKKEIKAYDHARYLVHKERMGIRFKKWRLKNLDKRAATASERRANEVGATPKWANQFFIGEAYHLAKLRTDMLGFRWTVDHIVPIKSRFVCGLHCEQNMVVIPASENFRKGNHNWPNMP